MLEKYKGKEVKILVSSDSGAGIGVDGNYIASMTSVITLCGTINDLDNKFLEIKNSKLSYIGDFNKSSVGLGVKDIEPTVYENDITLVNIDKIISISII